MKRNTSNIKKSCIGCITDYTSGDYVYFNQMIENPESHNIDFILNQRHDIYIISQLKIMEETFLSYQKVPVKKILEA